MKTVKSPRNPLTKRELEFYKIELQDLIFTRSDINKLFGKKYSRVYTEPQAGGKCRMKLFDMKKKHMKRFYNTFKKYSYFPNISIEKHVDERWYCKVYSLVLRVK